MSAEERRLIGGTAFNLGNDEYSIHQIVYRWARRFLDLGRPAGAAKLMDAALGMKLFAEVPDFSPLTLDSLMVPDEGPEPSAFADFDVAQHPDRRIHEVYAAAYAALGDMPKARQYLAALDGTPMELTAVIVLAETLNRHRKWKDAIAILEEQLATPAGTSRQETIQAYILIANIQMESGNRAAAKTTLDNARKTLGKDKQFDAARRRLRL